MSYPFRYFKASPEIIRLAVMMYLRFPLSLRIIEDLLHERGIGISHETVRYWWNRFGPLMAREGRVRRNSRSAWRLVGGPDEQPVSVFQNFARDHLPGGHDVYPVPAVASECGRPAP